MGRESVRLAKKEVPTGLFTLLSPVTLGLEGPASTLGLSRFRAASGTWVFRGPGPQKQDWTSLRAFGITHAVCEFPPGLWLSVPALGFALETQKSVNFDKV